MIVPSGVTKKSRGKKTIVDMESDKYQTFYSKEKNKYIYIYQHLDLSIVQRCHVSDNLDWALEFASS